MVLRDHAGRRVRPRSTGAGAKARESLPVSRSIGGAKLWLRRRLFWVEDHPEPVVGTLTMLWLLGWGSAVLLLKWALVVSLVVQVAGALTIVVATVSAALAIFRWLKRRRDGRSTPGSSVPPPLPTPHSEGAGEGHGPRMPL